MRRFAKGVWNAGFTPGSMIRGLGPWGRGLVGTYAERRFKQGHHLGDEETRAFADYMYHLLAAKGSGELWLFIDFVEGCIWRY